MKSRNPWSRYATWRTVRWLLFIFCVPGICLGAYCTWVVFQTESGVWWSFLFWTVAMLYSSCRVLLFRCPRCGEHFFRNFILIDQYAKKCAHCGLAKWDTPHQPGHPAGKAL